MPFRWFPQPFQIVSCPLLVAIQGQKLICSLICFQHGRITFSDQDFLKKRLCFVVFDLSALVTLHVDLALLTISISLSHQVMLISAAIYHLVSSIQVHVFFVTFQLPLWSISTPLRSLAHIFCYFFLTFQLLLASITLVNQCMLRFATTFHSVWLSHVLISLRI